MFRIEGRAKTWCFTKKEKDVIRNTVLKIVDSWRQDNTTKDYVMVQPGDIILHNRKGAVVKNKRFVNKVKFSKRGNGEVVFRQTVQTDELYLNQEFLQEIAEALEALDFTELNS